MWSYNYNDELYHHGIKGMKWGVRRTQSQLGHDTGGTNSKKSKRQLKAEAKQLKKDQKEWDKNFNKNWTKAYNKAADESTKIADQVNKKYEKFDFSDLSDPKVKKAYDQYIEEYMSQWEDLLQRNYDEMFGKRPE